jgi:preprotein translocase subunit Sss1
MLYENKVEIIEEFHLLNLLGENISKMVKKPSHKYHLLINVTCVGIPS